MARPLPVIAGTLRVIVRGTTAFGTRWTNVIHLKKLAGDPIAADYAPLVAPLNQLYNGPAYAGGAGLLSNMNSATKVNDYTFESLATPVAVTVLAATATGAGVANSLPPEVALVVSIRTAVRGKRYRGRFYLPPPTVTNVDANGNFAAGFATTYPAQCVGFNNAIQALASPYKWVVASQGFSLLKNGQTSLWVPFTTDAASFSVDLLPDVQRRRKS